MPASENPKKDREIFLKILTMDDEGLWLRKNKSIPMKVVYKTSLWKREKYFEESNGKAYLIAKVS
jgi:putative DNA methylase